MIVEIDTSQVVEAFDLLEEQSMQLADVVIKALAMGLYDEWVLQAQDNLSATRKQYVQSLVLGDDGFLTSKVTLTGQFANDLESGKEPWDMKPSFAESPKRKTKENGGWYMHIPFRHAVPGSVGEAEAFTSVIPEDVFDALTKVAKRTPEGKNPTLKHKDLPESS